MIVRPGARASLDYAFLVLGIAASVFAVLRYPGRFGADAHAVYLPVARGLLEGYGLPAFASLVHGALRLPGYATLLAASAGLSGDLRLGAQLLNALSMVSVLGLVFFGLRRVGATAPWPGVAAVLVALEANLLEAGGHALPDAVAVGLVALFAALLLRAAEARGQSAVLALGAAGLVTGLALQVRLNLGALWMVAAVFLVWRHRGGAGWRLALFTALGVLPLIVIVPISDALHALGITYPSGSWEAGVAVREKTLEGTAGWSRLFAAGWLGVRELPERLWASTGGPWVLMGAPALLLGLYRRPADPVRVLATATFACLVGALLPIHFEARYYTFAAPILVGATVVALDGLLRGPWARWLSPIVILGLASWVLTVTPMRLRVLENRRATENLVDAACAHLDALRGDQPALFVTWNSPKVLYSRFGDCETRVGAPTRIFIADATPGQNTAAVRLTESTSTRRYTIDRPERRAQFGPFNFDLMSRELEAWEVAELAKPPGPLVLSRRWTKSLPWAVGKACQSESLTLPPGRYRWRLRMPTRGQVAGRVDLGIGKRFLRYFGANGTTHDRIVEIDRRRLVTLRFCPISPYKSGRIDMELELHALPEIPDSAPVPAP